MTRGVRMSLCALTIALAGNGCMIPRSNSQRLMDAAREMNDASRFGRLDVAAEHTTSTTREGFLTRRKRWGNDIRVVDVHVSGLKETSKDHAEVLVQVSWTRMDEGLLRATQISQLWENLSPGGWKLQREKRASGDLGLFGEVVSTPKQKPHGDVHFQSRTLGSGD